MFVPRSRPGIAALAAALALAVPIVAGCSGGSAHHPATTTASRGRPAGPDPATVAWVGKVCAADALFRRMVYTVLPVTSERSRSRTRAYVKLIGKELRAGVATFEAIGHAPVSGGDEVVAAYVRGLKDALRTVKETESYLRGSAPVIVEGGNLPLLLVSTAIGSLAPKGTDLPSLISRDPALGRAFRAAPPCRGSVPATEHTPTPTPSR